MGKQQQQPAGNRQVLLEMQELIPVAKFVVEQNGGGHAEPRQYKAAARV